MQRREGIKVVLVAACAHDGAPPTRELPEQSEIFGPIMVSQGKQGIVGETHRHLLLKAALLRSNGLGRGLPSQYGPAIAKKRLVKSVKF
jgi:hypothetical protein